MFSRRAPLKRQFEELLSSSDSHNRGRKFERLLAELTQVEGVQTFFTQLVEHGKKFLIIGNQNAITSREIFPLIKENKLWLGVDNGGTKWFQVQEDYDIKTESRKKIVKRHKVFQHGKHHVVHKP